MPAQAIDLSNLAASEGFIIQGDGSSDIAGSSVSNAGDVNGDGIDDLIVGAERGSDGGRYAGEIDSDGNGVADEVVRIDGLVALMASDFALI